MSDSSHPLDIPDKPKRRWRWWHIILIAAALTVILAGGGANIFQSYFSTYPNLHVAEEPSLSNVRGYLKLARKTRW